MKRLLAAYFALYAIGITLTAGFWVGVICLVYRLLQKLT